MILVRFAVEGRTDVPIAERLIRLVGLEPADTLIAGGKSRLDPKIAGLNRSAAGMNWLILRDLDHDAPCAAALARHLIGAPNLAPRLSFRVPVRAAESWLLADAEAFGDEFFVAQKHLPDEPDSRDDAKGDVVAACRHSARREVRRTMAPRPGSGRKVGPEDTSRVTRFAAARWDPKRAAPRSPSLRRAVAALRRKVNSGAWS